jgi:hypothetical protein
VLNLSAGVDQTGLDASAADIAGDYQAGGEGGTIGGHWGVFNRSGH